MCGVGWVVDPRKVVGFPLSLSSALLLALLLLLQETETVTDRSRRRRLGFLSARLYNTSPPATSFSIASLAHSLPVPAS